MKGNRNNFMNSTTRQMITWIVIIIAIVIILQVLRGPRSGYALHEISIKEKNTDSLFGGAYDLKCVPGGEQGDYYTKGLSPGGMCGIQKTVSEQAEYEMVGGIGEPLI